MRNIQDNKAEGPIEVSLYVLVVIIVMSFLMFSMGPFVDKFLYQMSLSTGTLSAWGQNMMLIGPIRWAVYLFAIPTIFIIIVMAWGIKTVIKRKQYTTAQNGVYMNTDDEF